MSAPRKVKSRKHVAQAALSIIDEAGLQALTMRRLGRHLGVEAMSLYRHVSGRDDVLAAVHGLLLEQVRPPIVSGDWIADALALARAFREVLMQHPEAVPIVATRPATEPAAVDLLEVALELVPEHQVSPSAADIVQTLFAFVVGHCSFHAALANSDGAAVALDPKRHVRLADVTPSPAAIEFERGLTLVAAGLRQLP